MVYVEALTTPNTPFSITLVRASWLAFGSLILASELVHCGRQGGRRRRKMREELDVDLAQVWSCRLTFKSKAVEDGYR